MEARKAYTTETVRHNMETEATLNELTNAVTQVIKLQSEVDSGEREQWGRDADTILEDIVSCAETEVSGTGLELLQIYMDTTDKISFCRMFEAFTGERFDAYLRECIKVLEAKPPMSENKNSLEVKSVAADAERTKLSALADNNRRVLIYTELCELRCGKDRGLCVSTPENCLALKKIVAMLSEEV